MGSLSNYAENELLDHVLKVGAYTPPTHIYIALSTADPTDDASGLSEPSGGSYARILCDDWDTAASRAIQNTSSVEYVEATGSWGTLTHFAIMDALTGGNMLAYGSLSESKVISSGDTASFAAGAIDIIFSTGGVSNYLANKLLDHLFKNTSYTPATNIYIALSTATIQDSNTGSTITEPASNYARINHDSYDAAASGASENTGAITFATATGAWGLLTDFALIDYLTVGEVLFYGVLDDARTIGVGDTPHWNDGALDITLD